MWLPKWNIYNRGRWLCCQKAHRDVPIYLCFILAFADIFSASYLRPNKLIDWTWNSATPSTPLTSSSKPPSGVAPVCPHLNHMTYRGRPPLWWEINSDSLQKPQQVAAFLGCTPARYWIPSSRTCNQLVKILSAMEPDACRTLSSGVQYMYNSRGKIQSSLNPESSTLNLTNAPSCEGQV